MSLQLNALQMQDGQMIWHQPITAAQSWLWYLAVTTGTVYVVHALSFQGLHPTFQGLSVEAFATDIGTRRWSDQPTPQAYTEVHASSTVGLRSAGETITSVRVSDGSVLWQRTLASASSLLDADGVGVFFSVTSTGRDTWLGSLCGLYPDTGATRWCQRFPTELAAVVLGP